MPDVMAVRSPLPVVRIFEPGCACANVETLQASAVTFVAAQGNLAAVQSRDLAGKSKPQAIAAIFRVLCGRAAVKLVKDLLLFVGGNAGAVVLDLDHD